MTRSAAQTDGAPTLPQSWPDRWVRSSRRAVDRAGRRGRFVAAAALTPALRGAPLAMGPRVTLRLGPQATFTRGRRCMIAGDFTGQFDGTVTWGDDVFVNVGAYMSVLEHLHVGHRVRFGERVSIHDEDHVFEPFGGDRGAYRTSPVVIEDDAWIGAGSIVLRGSRIGAGSVVAAGSVVRGEFAAGQLIAGVPARVVRPLRTHDPFRP